MFLKNKKLRGMSLVELLAYTVILSIVTTALFQAIHFIQKMNDDLNNEQQMLNEFNLSILKLDEFVTNSISDLVISDQCIKNDQEAFYFEKDGDFYRLIKSDDCSSKDNIVFSTKAIFNSTNINPTTNRNRFFQNRDPNPKNSVKYSFFYKSNSELIIDGSSYKKCI
jgi:type II secretory pathway pseudopilin PulG